MIRDLKRRAVNMISEQDIQFIPEPTLSVAERMYMPQIVEGLGITLRHLLMSGRTLQYPEERLEVRADNYRGVHRLNRDEQGRVACVACSMCSTACPVKCIQIEAQEAPWDDREKYPVKYEIDELRCIYCGMCQEACPVDAPMCGVAAASVLASLVPA